MQRDQDELQFLTPSEMAVVEVYPHGYTVPLEFMRPPGMCGAVVVWTKRKLG